MGCLWTAVLAFLVAAWHGGQCDEVAPNVTGSFSAAGELVETTSLTGPLEIMTLFEENYNDRDKQAVASITTYGKTATFWLDIGLKEIFKYNDSGCLPITPSEWKKDHIAPNLDAYEKDDSIIYLPVKQLFDIGSIGFTGSKQPDATYRNIQAEVWKYNYTSGDVEIEVTSYWSVKGWNTTSFTEQQPLGFKIVSSRGSDVNISFVNIMYFMRNKYNWNAFQRPSDVYCPGNKSPDKFPNVKDFTVFSLRSDFVLPGSDEFQSVDLYLDTENKLMRVDREKSNLDSGIPIPVQATEITSYSQNVVYTIERGSGVTCTLSSLSNFKFDKSYIFNPKDENSWTPNAFYGLKDNSNSGYFYLERRRKRGLRCGLWQGLRSGWPFLEDDIWSVWEWCFVDKSSGETVLRGEDGSLINLEITLANKTSDGYPKGYKFIHHVYNFRQQTAPVLDNTFDISDCFDLTTRKNLQFILKVDKPDQKDAAVNAATNVDFVAQVKLAVTKAAGLSPTSLRVSQFRVLIARSALYVDFVLLDAHPKLPSDAKTEPPLKNVVEKLNSTIRNNGLKVQWSPQGSGSQKPISLTADPKSLKDSVKDKPVALTTVSPIITLSTTSSLSTTSTPSISPNPSATPSPKTSKEGNKKHTPGTMAAVGITMLLLGTALGLLATFFKYKYFPQWFPKC